MTEEEKALIARFLQPRPPRPLTRDELRAAFLGQDPDHALLGMLIIDVPDITDDEQVYWLTRFEDEVERLMNDAVREISASRRAALRKQLKVI